MAAPTAYVIAVSVFGLSHWIVEIGELLGAGRCGEWFLQHSWPLSLEYLLLTAFFAASIQLMYGINGLKRFLISLFFLGATGSFYMIDTFYPYGTITFLQAFAPITAQSAVHVLNWMGYKTQLAPFTYMGMPVLLSPGLPPLGLPPLAIGWPCAGVHSLFIYTFVILLFIKDAAIPFKWKITCIAIGAVGTFIVNVFRIVSICIIGSTAGSEAAQLFHSYYGELYFVAWILTYLTVIFLLSRRIYTKSPRSEPKPKQNGNSRPS